MPILTWQRYDSHAVASVCIVEPSSWQVTTPFPWVIGACRAAFDAQLRTVYLSLHCTLYVCLCTHMLYAADRVSLRPVLVI